MSRNPRKAIAAETVAILDRGTYTAPSGREISIADRLGRAVRETRLYRPDELAALVAAAAGTGGETTRIEVTEETTLDAARRLTALAGDEVACLNFASAKNPGGGFLRGAHAQEEGLARSSGLYSSLRVFPEFYALHREQGDLLYSDHLIYSPGVPVFRDDSGRLLDEPYHVAFLTSPAPNRGAIRDPQAAARVGEVLRERAAKVLAAARHHGHRRLVLGAWGCGVFGNDPVEVAGIFADLLLDGGAFAGCFEYVVFAVWDTAPGAPRHRAFAEAFSG
ncbi:TIGR02452 family protein [Thermomonospora echinospora]|uniref:TIGR02452 family protein n=1 Tax=Thermomonospora echinospora TaxID=1992 RepID=A0A1H5XIB6_9ACTN|nr:TIGR02452 family protein [Thermomonospora echinospora]SEG11363.1 TIGR02452 family protein [Thermomonospora echinospora]